VLTEHKDFLEGLGESYELSDLVEAELAEILEEELASVLGIDLSGLAFNIVDEYEDDDDDGVIYLETEDDYNPQSGDMDLIAAHVRQALEAFGLTCSGTRFF
jgi:hypothetical protein